MMNVLLVSFCQFSFILLRTMNVRYVAKDNMIGALITGGIVNVLWVITTWMGVNAFNSGDWITATGYLIGGLAGVYYGMREKQILQAIQFWLYYWAIDYECKPDGLHIIFYRNTFYGMHLKGASKKEVIQKFIHDYTKNQITFEVQKGYFFNLN